MEDRRWRLRLITPARELSGRTTQVVVGVISTDPGYPQIGMRIGEHGETVILPRQAAAEVIANLRKVTDERLKYERGR